MKYSLQGHFIFKVSLMSLFCLFLSLVSLSSPVETNPTCHLSCSHITEARGGMLTNKSKNPPHNWLEKIYTRFTETPVQNLSILKE